MLAYKTSIEKVIVITRKAMALFPDISHRNDHSAIKNDATALYLISVDSQSLLLCNLIIFFAFPNIIVIFRLETLEAMICPLANL